MTDTEKADLSERARLRTELRTLATAARSVCTKYVLSASRLVRAEDMEALARATTSAWALLGEEEHSDV